MGTLGFKEPAPAADEDTQLAETQEQAPATVGGDFAQETIDPRYINFDKLQIVNKVGKLSEEFPKNSGEWVVGESDLWGDEPLTVVVLLAPHWLEQVLPFDSPDMPRRFRDLPEAFRAGFSHADDGAGENQVVDLANLFLLVKHEDGDLEAPDDTTWAVVQLAVRKGGFKDTWTKWNTQRITGRLRDVKGGTTAGFWDLAIRKKSGGGNTWYAPILRKPKAPDPSETTEEFRAWVKDVFGSLTGE